MRGIPIAAAVLYPLFLYNARFALSQYQASSEAVAAMCVLFDLLLAFAIPLGALLVFLRPASPLVFALVFACPSLFSATFTLSRRIGATDYPWLIWAALWLVLGLVSMRVRARVSSGDVTRTRVAHGVVALAVLLSFLLAHLAHHDTALWSVALHFRLLPVLRSVYRSIYVEPILLAGFAFLLISGARLALHYATGPMDRWRRLQIATGICTGAFVFSHVLATLTARAKQIETDWYFAAGPVSLLESPGMSIRLIPHYFLGPLSTIVHAACGLRGLLLAHGVSVSTANTLFAACAAAALVVTSLSMAALLGLHFTR